METRTKVTRTKVTRTNRNYSRLSTDLKTGSRRLNEPALEVILRLETPLLGVLTTETELVPSLQDASNVALKVTSPGIALESPRPRHESATPVALPHTSLESAVGVPPTGATQVPIDL